MLKSIEGRSTDFVIAADGTILHGLSLIYILRDMETVESFKIIQESKMETRVQVVAKSGNVTEEMSNTIVAGFQSRLGKDVVINVEPVAEIAAEKSGKYRYVISKVEIA